MSQEPRGNGEWAKEDTRGAGAPSSEMELYDRATRPQGGGEFLEEVNLGLGNYSEWRHYQQLDSYKKGLFADAAFAGTILRKAIREAMRAEARAEWRSLSESARDSRSKKAYLRERGREIWAELSESQRRTSIKKHTGLRKDWKPPHWRMLSARHESSRSLGARLLDNLFGRVTETEKTIEMPGGDSGGWLSGGNSRTRSDRHE